MDYQLTMPLTASEAAMKVLDVILDNATLHPKIDNPISHAMAFGLSNETLIKKFESLLVDLKHFPNVAVAEELLRRFKCKNLK